jgi:predicted glycosyltransferase involved in capsule biosynthesis
LPFDLNYPNVAIYKNPKKGAASARNFGASIAKYSILFFIDDDMWMTTESILAIKKLHTDSFFVSNCSVLNWQYPQVLINEMEQQKIGRYLLNANYHTLVGRAKIEINHSADLFKVNSIGSGSFVISKELFTAIGGYNENFIFQGEDVDLSNKLNTSNIYTNNLFP